MWGLCNSGAFFEIIIFDVQWGPFLKNKIKSCLIELKVCEWVQFDDSTFYKNMF